MDGSNGNSVTSGNDTIIGTIDGDNTTLNVTDQIDAGDGSDTLKVIGGEGTIGTATVPNFSNVETLSLSAAGTAKIDYDTSAQAGLEKVNVTAAADTTKLNAAETVDVNVSGAKKAIDVAGGNNVSVTAGTGKQDITVGEDATVTDVTSTNAAGSITVTDTDQGEGVIDVDGGTNVTIEATSETKTGNITVGDKQAASGDVSVTQNLESDGAGIDSSAAKISVTGGATVDVNVNGSIVADEAGDNGNALKASDIAVVGDGETTTVNVTQNLSSTNFSEAGAEEVVATEDVTFKALAKGESVTVAGLTFTATTALAAEDVAGAFAGLTKEDTQTATGPTANGYFTGDLDAGWTSGAAAGAVVTFTGAAHNTAEFTPTSTAAEAPTKTYVAGTTAGADKTAEVSTVYGTVDVQDNATSAIETVTVDGFASASLGDNDGAADTKLDSLTTLNLANNAVGGDVVLASDAETLALNLDNITSDAGADEATINLDDDGNSGASATVTALNLTATGSASDVEITGAKVADLSIDAQVDLDITDSTFGVLETVSVDGAGHVILGGVDAQTDLNSFNASANTGGITGTVEADADTLDGTISEYVLSSGDDDVTVKASTGSEADVKVSGGEGDDIITLSTGIQSAGAVISGGAGTDTLAMDAADAEAASSASAFEATIDGFEKLAVGEVATTAQNTVDLANMDEISYVETAGDADEAHEVDVTVNVTTQLDGGNTDTATITVDGVDFTTDALTASGTSAAADDAQVIAAGLATKIDADADYSASATGGVLTVTAANSGKVLKISSVSVTGTGAASSTNATTSSLLTLDNMANDGTVELTDAGTGVVVNMEDATGSADSLNVVTPDLGDVNVGNVVANGVETINISTTDTFVDKTGDTDIFGNNIADGKDDTNSAATLTVSSDKLTDVTVGGAGDLTLTASEDTLTTVDASAMEGKLTFTADVDDLVVTAGSADDVLTADAAGVEINGGAGDDQITVTANASAAIIDGGEGADIFDIIEAKLGNEAFASFQNIGTGDVFKLGAGVEFSSKEVNMTLDDPSTSDYINAAFSQTTTGEAIWFNNGTNTYVAINQGDAGFDEANDVVVKLSGLVDLSAASYNQDLGTLEIA